MICFACKYSQFLSLLLALSCFSLYNIDVNIHLKCPCYLSLFISLVICNSFIHTLSLSLALFLWLFSLFKEERASTSPLCFTLISQATQKSALETTDVTVTYLNADWSIFVRILEFSDLWFANPAPVGVVVFVSLFFWIEVVKQNSLLFNRHAAWEAS